jgi:hypothetical protein
VDKRQIVEQAVQPGASLSEVARSYGIAARVLFRWKQELTQVAPLHDRRDRGRDPAHRGARIMTLPPPGVKVHLAFGFIDAQGHRQACHADPGRAAAGSLLGEWTATWSLWSTSAERLLGICNCF